MNRRMNKIEKILRVNKKNISLCQKSKNKRKFDKVSVSVGWCYFNLSEREKGDTS